VFLKLIILFQLLRSRNLDVSLPFSSTRNELFATEKRTVHSRISV